MKTLMILTVALLLGLPVLAVAHDEAKTPISPSIILDMSKPVVPSRDKAYNESLRDPGPAPAKSPMEGVVQQASWFYVVFGSRRVLRAAAASRPSPLIA